MIERRAKRATASDGTAFRLLVLAYLFWTLVVTLTRIGGGCTLEPLCRMAGSGTLSTLVTAVPLALILGSLATRRADESTRLFAIAAMAAALIVAPTLAGDFIASWLPLGR